MKKFYITTAIDYVNSLPHIGTAYEKIAADCIARSKRLLGYDVRFCMGTDEHSVNVKRKANEEGLDPQTYSDRMAPRFQEIWRKLEISNDDFIRTTEMRHARGVAAIFRKIRESGDIYSDVYKGWYCEGCEAFIQEKDLEDGCCPNHRTRPAWIEERNYFFRLSRYGSRLLDHIKANPGFIQPETRKNEIIRLIESGLEDISVSRSGFDWGIPLPDDPDHVVYVWFDALINYISALGYGGEDESLIRKYWPADLHVIGKDITRFHCVIWPAMLMSSGEPLPLSVFGHGFICHRGEKMSKSLGNVVAPLDIVDRFGADPLRYFLLREVVFGNDGDFTYERFIERYNSDLANDFGNLYSRVASMVERYFEGVIPSSAALPGNAVSGLYPETVRKWTGYMEAYNLSGACDVLWEFVRAANRRIEEAAPWKMAKDPGRRYELADTLYDLVCAGGGIAVLIQPVMPSAAESIGKLLNLPRPVADMRVSDFSAVPAVPKGVRMGKGPALFPRIEAIDDEIPARGVKKTPTTPHKETAALMNVQREAPADGTKPETGNPPLEEMIDIGDFRKVDIRVGTVLRAERVENSNKLVRFVIDDGMGGRTILAGVAGYVAPAELTGKQVVFVANLKPRKMMGEFSQGMVLAASEGDSLVLLQPAGEITPGSRVS